MQDKFIRWSFKIMTIVYIAGFVNYTTEFVLIVVSFYDTGFLIWTAKNDNVPSVIKFTLLTITGILMSICLLYNLARWYLIIQLIKGEKEALSKNL